MSTVALAAEAVPERHYTRHDQRGPTPHVSNPKVIHRDLTTLDVAPGMHVADIGVGSGYSGALLAHIVGPNGQVTSLDVDSYLVRWANVIHHDRGLTNTRCFTADGTAGFAERAPYHRIASWCTPPLLPASWVDQVADDGLIVTPLPIAPVPHVTVVARIRVRDGQPTVEQIFHGGYVETTSSPKSDFDVPGRWVDWDYRVPTTSWISTAWRASDDWRHTGARHALDSLLKDTHTRPYEAADIDWASWRTYAAATSDPQLTMVGFPDGQLAIGHSTPTTAAVIHQNGTILTDSPDSPSLAVLHSWLRGWEAAARPAPETYLPVLTRYEDDQGTRGWNLQLSQQDSLR